MKARTIEVHVEELVLEGFSAADRLRVGASLERELGRLVRERGLPAALTGGEDRPVVDAGTFTHAPGATPAAAGAGVARAVYRGLGRTR